MSKEEYTGEQQMTELNKSFSPETKEVKLDVQKNNNNSTPMNPNYNSNEMWNITREQTASLQALHQSMQHAGMAGNLNTLTAVAQQQQQAQQHSQQHQSHLPQQQQQNSPQLQYQQSSPSQVANETETNKGDSNTTTSTKDDLKPPVGSDEWHRLRRENHKQVERRRRETINEGINDIARIVPGCEKNKGSILHRAAAYIRQLKENESSTLEKWTLEKLLTDQAINELNRQVEILKVELDRVHQENAYLQQRLEDGGEGSNKRQKVEDSKE
ncbi:hypothetical protein K501DRAFT_229606 [Backusella circina FSU 941]|nr:hypothetical protein K501DRAFT_229606 [Backusella circina FSU 941]